MGGVEDKGFEWVCGVWGGRTTGALKVLGEGGGEGSMYLWDDANATGEEKVRGGGVHDMGKAAVVVPKVTGGGGGGWRVEGGSGYIGSFIWSVLLLGCESGMALREKVEGTVVLSLAGGLGWSMADGLC